MWWLLRRECAPALIVIAALGGLCAALRVVYTTEYPPGLGEDEVYVIGCNWNKLVAHMFFDQCDGLPVLLGTLFQAQLVPLIGTTRWSLHLYPLVTAILSVPAAFAVARALGCAVAASLAVAGLVTVLPWSLFYGRLYFGAELTFHELLVLAGLARLIFAEGGWPEVGIATVGQTLLFYDYWAGRCLLPFVLVAPLLARGRRRLMCLTVPVLAVFGWLPYLSNYLQNATLGSASAFINPSFLTDPMTTAHAQMAAAMRTFAYPVALIGNLTINTVAMHPWLVLLLAGFGAVTTLRRWRLLVFLIFGFVIGISPAALHAAAAPSGHRMMMAYPFVALAAGYGMDHLGWGRWRLVRTSAIVVLMSVITVQSVRFFFSPEFWSYGQSVFSKDLTALVEALPEPPHARLILASDIGVFMPLRLLDTNFEWLEFENGFPPNEASLYAFGPGNVPLQPFYQHLLGAQRVKQFGAAFLVEFEAGDWSWLRQHGWRYEMRCGGQVLYGQVPALYHPLRRVEAFPLGAGPLTVRWRGRWRGPATGARLFFSGKVLVETAAGQLTQEGENMNLEFPVQPDTPLTVTLVLPTDAGVQAGFFEHTPAGDRIPAWESVDPLD